MAQTLGASYVALRLGVEAAAEVAGEFVETAAPLRCTSLHEVVAVDQVDDTLRRWRRRSTGINCDEASAGSARSGLVLTSESRRIAELSEAIHEPSVCSVSLPSSGPCLSSRSHLGAESACKETASRCHGYLSVPELASLHTEATARSVQVTESLTDCSNGNRSGNVGGIVGDSDTDNMMAAVSPNDTDCPGQEAPTGTWPAATLPARTLEAAPFDQDISSACARDVVSGLELEPDEDRAKPFALSLAMLKQSQPLSRLPRQESEPHSAQLAPSPLRSTALHVEQCELPSLTKNSGSGRNLPSQVVASSSWTLSPLYRRLRKGRDPVSSGRRPSRSSRFEPNDAATKKPESSSFVDAPGVRVDSAGNFFVAWNPLNMRAKLSSEARQRGVQSAAVNRGDERQPRSDRDSERVCKDDRSSGYQ